MRGNRALTDKQEQDVLYLAMNLLTDDNLEWSADLNAIRPHLCNLFIKSLSMPELRQAVLSLAAKIVSEK